MLNNEKALTGVSNDEQLKEMIVVLSCHLGGRLLNFKVESVSSEDVIFLFCFSASQCYELRAAQEFVQKSQALPSQQEDISS